MINSRSEVNAIYATFVKELSFSIRPTEGGVQKIDGTTLDIYRMVVTAFPVTDKANRVKFFEKSFLVANISLGIVFEMLFFTLSDVNIDFFDQKL